jgi:hypothetical protein
MRTHGPGNTPELPARPFVFAQELEDVTRGTRALGQFSPCTSSQTGRPITLTLDDREFHPHYVMNEGLMGL